MGASAQLVEHVLTNYRSGNRTWNLPIYQPLLPFSMTDLPFAPKKKSIRKDPKAQKQISYAPVVVQSGSLHTIAKLIFERPGSII